DDELTLTVLTNQNLINEDYEILINNEESSTEKNDRALSKDSKDNISFEQFTAPDFDDFDSDLEYRYSNTNINFDDSWIVLWIFKYQLRFRLPDTAIDILIRYFRIVLLETDQSQFKGFLTSSYIARKLLEVKRQEKTYTVYPKCNVLYKISEILTKNVTDQSSSGFKCTYVEFSNYPKYSRRQPCETELVKHMP
ncbi:1462_t:CDS:2, partial [Funneliformis caledonium]